MLPKQTHPSRRLRPEEPVLSGKEIKEMTLGSPPDRFYTTLEAENCLDSRTQTSEVPTPVPMVPRLPAVLWPCPLPLRFPPRLQRLFIWLLIVPFLGYINKWILK